MRVVPDRGCLFWGNVNGTEKGGAICFVSSCCRTRSERNLEQIRKNKKLPIRLGSGFSNFFWERLEKILFSLHYRTISL